ncbi:MAG TPA: phosphate ABC transporter permease PstA, partial [Candidatus Krumholzibacteria bacterium]|nr:phosphate ABC transporter permease PstA [Candidatus Krumholzibacteria bacterium]
STPVASPNHSPPRKAPRARGGTSLLAQGENMLWLTGGALAVCSVMIVGFLVLVLAQGTATFWPKPLVEVTLDDGRVLLGEVTRTERFTPTPETVAGWSEQARARFQNDAAERGGRATRRLVRTGNFELTGTHFEWIDDVAVVRESRPDWATLLERRAWGRFYGVPKEFRVDGNAVASTPSAAWREFRRHHDAVATRFERRYQLQKRDFGELHARAEGARLEAKEVEAKYGDQSPQHETALRMLEGEMRAIESQRRTLEEEVRLLDEENARYELVLQTTSGEDAAIPLADVVRAFPANQLSAASKLGVYGSRWGEFLSDDPREANSEGGVLPAIVGTVIMTLLMSIAVVPFGVLAALYLREYAKAGLAVSAVRIAINNMAGVPSIVFGVFGLGFFCYIIGGSIDQFLFAEKLPNPTYGRGGVLWASLTLALLTLPVVVVSTEEALAAVPRSMREGSYACGASKWQTIRRIVLPRAMPGIMTGFILAMARGAGEVAPLMLVGAVKLAPDLPIDGVAPYLHPDRSFMHLGFHIYDVGFQSQNSEAGKPMVFTTTLLLITIIAFLNIAAVWLRTRLRRRFVGGTF